MKKLLSLFAFTMVFVLGLDAQKDISGTILDEEGIALIGANVIVKETTIGTVTDIDGSYSLTVPAGAQFVVVSFTGYDSREIDISNGTQFDFSMQPNTRLIDEVVLVGYKNTTSAKSANAVQTISSETIEGRPNPSIVQTLQGQVAGLNITTSTGQPGGNSEILLRGVSSFNGNTEPLFIIDGAPVDEDNFRSLNPNEIETISVLKDAGATAIYGNRGANGVIVIKTKGGGFNSGLKIGYSTLVGRSFRQADDYSLLGAQDQLRLEQEFGAGRGAAITEDSISRVVGTDWLDFFLRNPITQTHNLSISTGGENFNTFTNFGYADVQGILEDSGLERYSLRTNLNGKSKNGKFRFGTRTSVNFSTSDEPNNIGSGAINRNFILGAYQSVPYISIDEYVDGAGLLSPLSFANTPLFLFDRLQTFTRVEKEVRGIGTINASYDILDNLTFSSNLGLDFTSQNRLTAEGPASFNALLFGGGANPTSGQQTQSNTQVFTANWWNSLSYDFDVANDHNFSVSVFSEYFRAFYDFFTFTNEGLDARTFSPGDGSGFVADNAANDFFSNTVGAEKLSTGLFSLFGTIGYDYADKYGVDFTLRRDASSRFAESNRWGTFWSVAGRWNIDQEPFMANSTFDLLKLRASYGITGNQRIVDAGGLLNFFGGPDLTEDFFGTGPGYAGLNSIILTQIGNSTLRWESLTTANIGVDFEVLNSKLRGSFDVYSRTTDDLFQNRPISAVTSITAQDANVGSLRNSGFDANLTYNFLRTSSGLNADVYFNINYNKQEILELPNDEGIIREPNGAGNIIQREGGVIGEYWIYEYVGVNPANGNLLFLNAEGEVTENPTPDDRTPTGKNRFPDFQGGFGLNIDYKGVFLETQFNYTSGIDRFDFDYASAVDATSIGQFRHSSDLLRAWENPGDITDIPSLTATNFALEDDSDRFLFDGDYVRLRFVRLGYTLPKSILSSLNVNRFQIYATAENLTTFTGWRGFDVEGAGAASRGFPTPRVISFGLDVEF